MVPSGEQCTEENVVKTFTVSEENTIIYSFTEEEADKEYDICYAFGTPIVSEAPIKNSLLSIQVRIVPTITSEIPALTNDGIVMNNSKSFLISGMLTGEGDKVYITENMDCTSIYSTIPVNEDKKITVSMNISREEPFKMCYEFAGLSRLYSIQSFITKSVIDFVIADANNTMVVAGIPKQFLVFTHGGNEGDVAKMVTGDNCDVGTWMPVQENEVVFTLPYSEEPYKLCYQFYNEEPILYSTYTVIVNSVNEIQIDDGLRNDAVIFGVDNAIHFTSITGEGDRIYPLANPLNQPISEFTYSDCLSNGITIDDYIAKSADGAYHVSVYTGGSIIICYLFEGETQPFLTELNLLVLGVINPTIISQDIELGSSSNLWAVKNVTSTLRLYSSDTYDQAQYKWIASDAEDCNAPAMSITGEPSTITRDEESGFMIDEFAFDNYSVGKWKLCYQFFGKKWVMLSEQSVGEEYPPITVESRALLDITDIDGAAFDEIIPTIEKQWSVNVANGKEGDKMRLVTGISCTNRHEILAEADVQGYIVAWNVETEYPTANVCYGYNNGDSTFWVLYPDYSIDFIFITDITTIGNKNLLYVNRPKEYELHGSYVDRVDEVFFVPVNAICDNSTMVSAAEVVNGKATVVMTEAIEDTLKLCIHFIGHMAVSRNGEQNILEVQVVDVTGMQSVEGYSHNTAVVSKSKQFHLSGSHTELVKSVLFSKSSTCSTTFKEFDVVESGFNGNFDQHSDGELLYVCVVYEGEAPIPTSIDLTLKSLNIISANKGDSRVLLWGDVKTITLQGFGLTEEDTAEFVLASSVPQDEE